MAFYGRIFVGLLERAWRTTPACGVLSAERTFDGLHQRECRTTGVLRRRTAWRQRSVLLMVCNRENGILQAYYGRSTPAYWGASAERTFGVLLLVSSKWARGSTGVLRTSTSL